MQIKKCKVYNEVGWEIGTTSLWEDCSVVCNLTTIEITQKWCKNGAEVGMVESFKFLCINIAIDLSSTNHMEAMATKTY